MPSLYTAEPPDDREFTDPAYVRRTWAESPATPSPPQPEKHGYTVKRCKACGRFERYRCRCRHPE